MVLGIGFIMIAAIFPVAIKQTQATGEETNASHIAKGGVDYFEKIASGTTMPPTTASAGPGKVVASGLFWNMLQGNLIIPSDPRYAWVPLYKRDMDAKTGEASPYAQVIIIGVQVRNRSQYEAKFDTAVLGAATPNLQARPLTGTFVYANPAGSGPDLVTLADSSVVGATTSAAEGAYLVVADDASTGGATNGFIYRLGNPTSTANQWELAPGNDTYGSAATNGRPAASQAIPVFMLGRGYNDVSASPADTTFSGPAQDVAVYTTFVTVH